MSRKKSFAASYLRPKRRSRTFQEKEKIIDAPQEVNADLGALASFERNLKETDSSIRETEQKIAILDDQLKQQKATISSSHEHNSEPRI